MQARNAHFNVNKLGTIADRFHRHYYGDMQDAVNRGERSDRLEARWGLDGARASPDPPGEREVVLAREGSPDHPEPGATVRLRGRHAVVEVPPDYLSLRVAQPGLAARWREAVAEAIEACLGAGLVARGFLREGAYVFGPQDRA
jgi:predicted GNAT superfamily acetyltransferase